MRAWIAVSAWIMFVAASGAEAALLSPWALRTGNETCWARYALSDGSQVCVPKAVFARWLKQDAARESWDRAPGRWKLSRAGMGRTPGERSRIWSVTGPPGRKPSRLASFVLSVEQVREWSAEHLRKRDPWGVLARLAVDQRTPGGTVDLLRLSGFVHVASASGIHLYALAAGANAAAAFLLLFCGWSPQGARRASLMFSIVLWGACWTLGGMRPGMLRPMIIVGLRAAARGVGARWAPGAPLVLALALDGAIAILRWSQGAELAPWAPGRWHYALAVGGGLAALEWVRAIERGPHSWRAEALAHLAMSVGSWLATAVWDAATLGWVAPWTPALSLATIPLYSQFLLPAALLSCAFQILGWTSAAAELALAMGELSGVLIGGLARAVWWGGGLWVLAPGTWIFAGVGAALMVGARAALRARWGSKGAILGGGLVLLLLSCSRLVSTSRAGNPSFPLATQVVQRDVGQGDSAWVLSPGGAGWVDTGSGRAFHPARILEEAQRLGVGRIDWVLITHLDEDHVGALPGLSRLIPLGCVRADRLHLASERGKELTRELGGQGVMTTYRGCVPYQVFQPRPGGSSSGNDRMLALGVPLLGGGAYVNGGDMSASQEEHWWPSLRHWLSRAAPRAGQGAPLVLKASHHGSRFGTSEAWLGRLAPSVIWISAGPANPHGHPSPEVLARAQGLGISVRRTDLEGELSWVYRQGN
ncbi:MAG: MBL fold metallo-hydrolase [Bdellovibrionales bacterium]|nr:MBL fold metallo-hydrolase [Bdellovibrionales bacterium]